MVEFQILKLRNNLPAQIPSKELTKLYFNFVQAKPKIHSDIDKIISPDALDQVNIILRGDFRHVELQPDDALRMTIFSSALRDPIYTYMLMDHPFFRDSGFLWNEVIREAEDAQTGVLVNKKEMCHALLSINAFKTYLLSQEPHPGWAIPFYLFTSLPSFSKEAFEHALTFDYVREPCLLAPNDELNAFCEKDWMRPAIEHAKQTRDTVTLRM